MLIIDGVDYSHVAIVNELIESFELVEGESSVVKQSGRDWYDIIGTRYSHTVAILRNDEAAPEEWDEFCNVISSPVDFHTVEVDHDQGSITYEAHITSGERRLLRVVGGKKIWSDLTLNLRSAEPQRSGE